MRSQKAASFPTMASATIPGGRTRCTQIVCTRAWASMWW